MSKRREKAGGRLRRQFTKEFIEVRAVNELPDPAGLPRIPGFRWAPRRSGHANVNKRNAVQMMLDGHSASSVAKNLGLENANLLYRWKAEILANGGPAAETLDHQVRELRQQLHRVDRG
jgi:transposase